MFIKSIEWLLILNEYLHKMQPDNRPISTFGPNRIAMKTMYIVRLFDFQTHNLQNGDRMNRQSIQLHAIQFNFSSALKLAHNEEESCFESDKNSMFITADVRC